MDLNEVIYLYGALGAIVGALFGFFVAWVFGNPLNEVKLKRGLFKKNLGLLRLTRSGKLIAKKIVDFGQPSRDSKYLVSLAGGTYAINPDLIVLEQGVPVVSFDEQDCWPLAQTKEDMNRKQSPEALNGMIISFEQVTQARAMANKMGEINKLLMLAVILAGAAAGIMILASLVLFNEIEGAKAGIGMVQSSQQLILSNLTTHLR